MRVPHLFTNWLTVGWVTLIGCAQLSSPPHHKLAYGWLGYMDWLCTANFPTSSQIGLWLVGLHGLVVHSQIPHIITNSLRVGWETWIGCAQPNTPDHNKLAYGWLVYMDWFCTCEFPTSSQIGLRLVGLH